MPPLPGAGFPEAELVRGGGDQPSVVGAEGNIRIERDRQGRDDACSAAVPDSDAPVAGPFSSPRICFLTLRPTPAGLVPFTPYFLEQ